MVQLVSDFRKAYARWRAAYPWHEQQQARVVQLLDKYEEQPERLQALYRRLTVWCESYFAFDKTQVA
jgi:hypothetical protein